jgi:hypothetical protein
MNVASRWMLVLPLLLVGLAGCKSTTPIAADGALAWVEIEDQDPLDIARAVSQTFQEAGYQPVPLPRNNDLRLQFEKAAGAGTAVLYSDWSLKKVWYRARIELKRQDANTFLVTCNAFRVNERGDPHFEEEKKLSSLRRSPYQELLDQAKQKLNSLSKGTQPGALNVVP